MQSLITVPAVLYPHKFPRGKKTVIEGHYLLLSALFPLGTPEVSRIQFMGVHEGLVLTVARPPEITDLVRMVMDTRDVLKMKKVAWIGGVKMYERGRGVRYYIPKGIWNPRGGLFRKILHTKANVRVIISRSGGAYTVAELPAITADLLLGVQKTIKQD